MSSWIRTTRGLALAAVACAATLACPRLWAASKPVVGEGGFHVVGKAGLPGDGGWDFLNLGPEGKRLYVAHNDSVQVLDAKTLDILGTVPGVTRAHGVAVVPELGKGFASSGRPGSVVAFSLKTFKRLADIPSSPDTDVILYDRASGWIFTFNGDSHNATVIDPKMDDVVKVLKLPGAPEAAVSDREGLIFDNLASVNQVARIDTQQITITARWSTLPGEQPTGIALDRAHHRLFVGCRNKMLVVMDSLDGRVLAHLPIGAHVDGTAFDPATGDVLDSCGDGTLSVIHEDTPDKYSLVENAPTMEGARTLAVSETSGRVYTAAARTVPSKTAKWHRKIVPGTFQVLVLEK